MKKTSIVFLVISVLLIVGGYLLIGQGVEMAEKEGVSLFKQDLTENGDLVEIVGFSEDDINKIFLDLEKVNVRIIGNSERSYVEIANFNAIEYSAYPNNHTFNIKSDIISAITGRAEGGKFSFDGVRDYLRTEDYNSEKWVNIYISANSSIKSINLQIEEGNVTVENITQPCDYNIKLGKGDVNFNNTEAASLFMCDVKKGNVFMNEVFVKRSDIKVENGNLSFKTPAAYIYDYSVEAEAGVISYNGESKEGVFSVYNDECNGDFTAHVGVGNVDISTYEKVIEPTTDNTLPEETTAENANV